MQVQKQYQFDINNEAAPPAQLQNEKSSAAETNPMSKHVSPERIIICYANEAGMKTQLQRGKANAQTSNSRNNTYYYRNSL